MFKIAVLANFWWTLFSAFAFCVPLPPKSSRFGHITVHPSILFGGGPAFHLVGTPCSMRNCPQRLCPFPPNLLAKESAHCKKTNQESGMASRKLYNAADPLCVRLVAGFRAAEGTGRLSYRPLFASIALQHARATQKCLHILHMPAFERGWTNV